MKVSTILGVACAATLFSAVSVRADVLALYPFTSSSLASTDTAATSTATDIVLGDSLTSTNRFLTVGNNTGLRVNSNETVNTTFPLAAADGDYFTFSVAPGNGKLLSLDTLTYDLAVNNVSLTTNVRVQFSTDGTGFAPIAGSSITGFSTASLTPESIDISSFNTALAAGLPLYMRFVVFDNANNATLATIFDNITVNGTVATLVPEPGTNALLALGSLGVAGGIWLRRRRATA